MNVNINWNTAPSPTNPTETLAQSEQRVLNQTRDNIVNGALVPSTESIQAEAAQLVGADPGFAGRELEQVLESGMEADERAQPTDDVDSDTRDLPALLDAIDHIEEVPTAPMVKPTMTAKAQTAKHNSCGGQNGCDGPEDF